MAEPEFVGYKRRKNLPDIALPNELYQENAEGKIKEITEANPATVLDYYYAGSSLDRPSSSLGFWTRLSDVASRDDFRLDPKYRWLWDYQQGVAHGDPDKSVALGKIIEVVDLPKLPKGELPEQMQVVDLEYVESRQAIVSLEPPTLDFIGSDKVRFVDCDLAISKLEPYLGKVMLNPMDCLGSTEWVGLRCTTDYPILTTAYLLMLPDMCEAYRRLQSGKRHARFDPKEFLGLMVELPDESIATEIEKEIKNRRNQIFDTRSRARTVRESIDVLFDE